MLTRRPVIRPIPSAEITVPGLSTADPPISAPVTSPTPRALIVPSTVVARESPGQPFETQDSCSRFQALSNPAEKASPRCLSIREAQFAQSQIAFSVDERSTVLSDPSYLGPPADAAVMCAATPIVSARVPEFGVGSAVTSRHDGFEQRNAARRASASTSCRGKLSRMRNERSAQSQDSAPPV